MNRYVTKPNSAFQKFPRNYNFNMYWFLFSHIYIVTCYTMQKSCFHCAVPKKAKVSRANKREECLYFVAPQRLATHVTRLAQQQRPFSEVSVQRIYPESHRRYKVSFEEAALQESC
jgi:hypothetical protein